MKAIGMKGTLAKVIMNKAAPSLQLSTSLTKEATSTTEIAPHIPMVTKVHLIFFVLSTNIPNVTAPKTPIKKKQKV